MKLADLLPWRRGSRPARRVRTPQLLQMEMVECGAAALGIMLGHHGLHVTLPELRRECGVSRDGSKASNVVKAARRRGLIAKGLSKTLESVRELPAPFIVFWHFNHFLVVEGFDDDGSVFLNDPAVGHRKVDGREFDEGFTGVVLTMEPGPDFEPGGEPVSAHRGLLQRVKGSASALLYCFFAGLLLVAPGLAIPVFTQLFIDEVLIERREDWLLPLLGALGATALLQVALSALRLAQLRNLRMRLAISGSSKFLRHLLRLPMSFYAQRFSGEVSGRMHLNDRVAETLSGQLATTAIDALLVLLYAGLMFCYDPLLTVIALVFSVGNVLALRFVATRRRAGHQRLLSDQGKLAGVALAGVQAVETLKASAQESRFFSKWAGLNARVVNASGDLGRLNAKLGIVPGLLSTLSVIALLLVGGLRVVQGELSLGMLIAFQTLMGSLQGPVQGLVGLLATIQELEGDLNRLDDVLRHDADELVVTQEALALPEDERRRLSGRVQLEKITYGYDHLAPPLISEFSLELEPGQRVALVGGSGSGKSTLARLVSGLYQPWEGQILLDGRSLTEIDKPLLASSVALVEQDLTLFSGSVRDNLTLWDDDLPPHRLVAACRDAAIEDVVLSLPGGYEAELLEGGRNLSGGQRQRLELARALAGDPTLLILDEATAALDTETERIIDRNLRRRGCTCIVVAHRLSTVRDCDEIIVLRAGKVVERGTHDELWSSDGEYARLLKQEGSALDVA
ncbi:MAG: NHLP family bacteriocin export ABC transporter peptidase/permease/ATPase subunit [Acidobacteriota bacterium]